MAGIPATATVGAAWLYWAGSGNTPDFMVTFNGAAVAADIQYTEVINANRSYFSGVADVTALLTGNGNYTVGGLTVDTGGEFCAVNGVLAGWALVVVYDDPAEPFRTINFFEGFQNFWGQSITLTPTNFFIPGGTIDGRLGVLSWEGDSGNSGTRNGVTENLEFDGASTAPIDLTDALNPLNNQYNSTFNGSGSTNVFGVDFDVYDVSAQLRAGDTSASTTYSSGQDRVFLSLEIISATNTPATDLALAKTHPGNFQPGSIGQFDFAVTNNGPLTHNDVVTITDSLPAGLSMTGFTSADPLWNCSGTTTVTCSHSGVDVMPGDALPTVSIQVSVPSAATGTFTNSAQLVSNVFDPFAANNTADDTFDIALSDLSASTKSVVDVNGGTVEAGDTLEFSIVLDDANDFAVVIDLEDALHPLLENLVVLDAGGGTDVSSGTTLDLDDIILGAGQTRLVRFQADILGTAAAGSSITNTAQLTDQANGTIFDVSSPDLTVGTIGGGASGIKPIYLNDIGGDPASPVLPMPMSRTPLSAPSAPVSSVRIRREEDDRFWHLTPPLAGDLGLAGTPIPLHLNLRRSNNTINRTVRFTLDYIGTSSGFFGCLEQVFDAATLTTTLQNFSFAVPQTDANCNPVAAAPLTLPAGTVLRLNVDNAPGNSGNGRAVFVAPYEPAIGESRLELPATNVINVESVVLLDAPFPGGAPVSSAEPGATVHIRSVVSDPFGAFDITAATLEVLDPSGTLVQSVALDPGQIVTSDTVSKTYEAAVTLPGTAPGGVWTARVRADEGTEGTISHTRATAFTVLVAPSMSLVKTSQTDSDPTGASNPKSIPGAVVEYTIAVTNSGPGSADADSIVINDLLPGEARLLFDPVSDDPLVFEDGAVPSGLSYTFGSLADPADDVRFSNDGGATSVTPVVDPVSGLDLTSPRINHLRINPKGTLLETSSGPSFSLRLKVQLD